MPYLDYETQAQKREDGSYLIKHKETGEPIAIVNKGYGKKVTGEWHPDFKLTHPEINDNILHSNMNSGQSESAYNRNSFDSLDSAKHRIGFLAKQFKTGEYKKDPVKVQYRGEEKEVDKTKHLYDMLDDEGQKFGTLKTEHSPKDVHAGSRVDATWDDEYRKNTNISDTTKEAAQKKHGGSDLESVLYRARYLLDNKDKEPRFIGTQQSDRAMTNVYKNKMKPYLTFKK